MSQLLTIEGLRITLPEGGDRDHAVEAINFDVARNEIVCLVGESGSGKSMIAHAILGLLSPRVKTTGGYIGFGGQDLLTLSRREMQSLRGGRISMIFQEPLSALNPLKKVGRQVAEAIRAHDATLDRAGVDARVVDLFSQVGLPDPERLKGAYPFQLSGGQRQRVMIAMALSNNPDLLIADEPTTALDVTTQRQILDLILKLRDERGMGVLFITHDIGVVADIADRMLVLRRGRMLEYGPADQVLLAPEHDYTRMLLDAVPGRGSVLHKAAGGAPMLEISALRKEFRTRSGPFAKPRVVVAADGIDLKLHQGETLAIVGESGSGKSTLARMVLRLVEADSGAVRMGAQNILGAGRAELREFRRRAQIIFQDPYSSLDPRMTVGESILRGPISFGMPRAQAAAEARDWLVRVGLDAQAFDRFPHEFSGGQRQRVCIARALALNPTLLIADEAVSALDVSVQAQVLQLLSDLKAEFGLSMLFITHDLRVAREIADRIVVMQHGRVVEQNEAAALFAAPQEEYTRTLLDAVPGRAFFARSAALSAAPQRKAMQ
ncbi:ABC transporter ATP-binding protein [Maritimibacter alkaliphilus]|uniref:ABC transporter ATP-binding protein n=1 Tax=Maritimibacter alkaliphilus TaxID=404236 RepID=UPI001C979BF4|nr:ABC transporter ATP-binding protein [Maritimibacter alkaliphilus]MBY6093105.1 ABC transporter ATP-binding protein [Maritimibacter alkaliphilus]